MKQFANLACLEQVASVFARQNRETRLGRYTRRQNGPSTTTRQKITATPFASTIAQWDGPRMAAEALMRRYGGEQAHHLDPVILNSCNWLRRRSASGPYAG
jgi:hypothetical protein